MQCEAPDKRFFGELQDLNREFLALLTDSRAGEAAWRSLGLAPATASQLRSLSAAELDFIASVPGLLADFRRLPGSLGVSERPPADATLDGEWLQAAAVFTAGLLTYLWQLSRRDRLLTAICLGPGPDPRQSIRAVSFKDIQHCAMHSAAELRTRLGWHPHWWADLLEAARSGDTDQRERCRLDLIALGLGRDPARPFPRSKNPQRPSGR